MGDATIAPLRSAEADAAPIQTDLVLLAPLGRIPEPDKALDYQWTISSGLSLLQGGRLVARDTLADPAVCFPRAYSDRPLPQSRSRVNIKVEDGISGWLSIGVVPSSLRSSDVTEAIGRNGSGQRLNEVGYCVNLDDPKAPGVLFGLGGKQDVARIKKQDIVTVIWQATERATDKGSSAG